MLKDDDVYWSDLLTRPLGILFQNCSVVISYPLPPGNTIELNKPKELHDQRSGKKSRATETATGTKHLEGRSFTRKSESKQSSTGHFQEESIAGQRLSTQRSTAKTSSVRIEASRSSSRT